MHVPTRAKAKVTDEAGVTGAKPVAELGDERFQILSSLLGRVDVPEKIPQRIREELVAEVMKGNQLVQDIPPAQTREYSHEY